MIMLAGGEGRASKDVEDEATVSSAFGITEVLMMETAGLLPFLSLLLLLLLLKQCLTVFLSEDEEGNGEDEVERQEGDEAPWWNSGSTRQAVGVSKSMVCFASRWFRMAAISWPT